MNECVNRVRRLTVLALPPAPWWAPSLHHHRGVSTIRSVFSHSGERGATDPVHLELASEGEMGPPGIPGGRGWAGVWGRGGARPQGV